MVTGSIYERKGIYYAIVSYYVDGRRKQKSVSTGLPVKGNKRRALEFLENLKRTYETKESMENMDGSRLLMTDYMDEWLKIVKPLVERATYKSYDNMVSARIRPHFEKLNLLLTEVEPKHIKMLYDLKFRTRLHHQYGHPLSRSSPSGTCLCCEKRLHTQ